MSPPAEMDVPAAAVSVPEGSSIGSTGEAATGSGSGGGKTRNRGPLSCAECRRLKLKCDRGVPCANCVRRRCEDLCPDGTQLGRKKRKEQAAQEKQPDQLVGALHDLLSQHGMSLHQSDHDGSMTILPVPPDTSEPGPSRPRRLSPLRPLIPSPRRSQSPSRRSSLPRYPDIAFTGLQPTEPTPISFEYGSPLKPSPQRSTHVNFESPHEESHGTLVLGKSGRSRYLGPTAGPEWLKHQEDDSDKTPAVSRAHSPPDREHPAFPFDRPFASNSADAILAALPSEDNGRALLESYYRYFTWNHNPAPRPVVQAVFEEAYSTPSSFGSTSAALRLIGYQRLALLYIVFALGALHSLELPPNDPSAEEFLGLAKRCLAKGDFLRNNTIAGVQALNIMGHYYLETEKGRDGESAWPIWGLVMRIIQAMGLHRDGERWNLPAEVVEERRHVFWECYAIEVFQANCNSRPSSFQRRHIDTHLPEQPLSSQYRRTFFSVKYELAQISHEIIDQAMDVTPPPYSEIQRLYSKLCAFERDVPFYLRCRTAALATTSVYFDPSMAVRDTPEMDRRDLKRTFEQFTLSLNIAENFLFLQRPYFVKAIHENTGDPLQSPYGDAYLAVAERSSIIIQVVRGLYELYPEIASRHWFYWYHLFTAAVCLGTIPIKNPHNPLSQYALLQLDQATTIYSSLRQRIRTQAIAQNHEWLVRLQNRAGAQVQAGYGESMGFPPIPAPVGRSPQDEQIDDASLLGWRTRLVQYAGHGGQARAPIVQMQPPMAVGTTLSDVTPPLLPPTWPGGMPESTSTHPPVEFEGVLPGGDGRDGQETSAGDLLQQLWDDMLQPGSRTEAADYATFNSWNWDSGLDPPHQEGS